MSVSADVYVPGEVTLTAEDGLFVLPPPLEPGASAAPETHRPTFHGEGGTLLGIQIVNVFLTFVTFGVYWFWGKVRVRSYLCSQTELEGDRFAYHGTGKELLLGWLKVAPMLFGGYFLLTHAKLLGGERTWRFGAIGASYALFLVFVPFARVQALRYRLSRTSWRGIRFSFRGSPLAFVRLYVVGTLLDLLTLMLYSPIYATRRQAFLTTNTWCGDRRFDFDGDGRELIRSYLRSLALTVPTLGLSWFFYLAAKQRYFWNHTTVGGARFHSTVTADAYLRLKLGNIVLRLFTLGFGWPWVTVRNARFAVAYLSLVGPLDGAGIRQDARDASATGEGLAGLLDGAGFDLG